MKELTIITHLGLGDLILQSGLAVHLAKEYGKVYFPCRKRDFNSVRSFFLLQPKIEVFSMDTDSTTPDDWSNTPAYHHADIQLLLGFYSYRLPFDQSISFAENYYRQAGVSYDVRWDECPIQEVVDTFYNVWWRSTTGIDRFVHDDSKRGFIIPESESEIRVIHREASILGFVPLMHMVSEIHVIDSCFLHLVESVNVGRKFFLHDYARQTPYPGSKCPTRKKWTVLT